MVPRNRADANSSPDQSGYELLRVLAVGARLEIIVSLIERERTVIGLAKALQLGESQITAELHSLLRHGLIQRRGKGPLQTYRLTEIVTAKLSGTDLSLTITDPGSGTILLEISLQFQ